MKCCKRCKDTKAEDEFHKDRRKLDGLQAICKECDKARKRERYEESPELFRSRRRNWAANNPDGIKAIGQKTRTKHGETRRSRNREKYATDGASQRAAAAAWRKDPTNAGKVKLQRKRRVQRIQAVPHMRAKESLRRRMLFVLHGQRKAARSMELVGCDVETLKAHLESLFVRGMSWENYGLWQIDHKRPCASFDLSMPDRQRECFHYTNLQPLWREENNKKSSTWEGSKHRCT